MYAGHLDRRTHLKRNTNAPSSRCKTFDLTDDVTDIALANIPVTSVDSATDILGWCAAMAADSPVANALWRDAAAQGWSVALADLHNGGFHIDPARKLLTLDCFSLQPQALSQSLYFRNALLLSFVRALRDIWHDMRCPAFEREFGPEDTLMLERVRAADCDAVTILAAWELRGAGHAGLWRHVLGMPEGDMAMAFTRYLERDPTALFDGSALAYAFRQWYEDGSRSDGIDHDTLERLDGILRESDRQRPFGANALQAGHIESIAILPDGACYLAGLGKIVMGDPSFAGLRDPINQSHFFQLMHDTEVTLAGNVPFRDPDLARKLFPETVLVKSWQ